MYLGEKCGGGEIRTPVRIRYSINLYMFRLIFFLINFLGSTTCKINQSENSYSILTDTELNQSVKDNIPR